MSVRLFGGLDDVGLTGIQATVADIVLDGPGKQIDILLNNADIHPQ